MKDDNHKVQFGTLLKDGQLIKTRTIRQSDMQRCPYVIMVQDHYRLDGTCRCTDPDHVEMSEWGYVWFDERWTIPIDTTNEDE